MNLHLNLGKNSYDIVVERGSLKQAASLLDLDRKVLIVTDDGVPAEYARTLAAACKTPVILTLPAGEDSKSPEVFLSVLQKLLEENFTRSDCVAAVGGGVMGDLAGFAAASYMRGIDFYNIPTTTLAQIDSSIGGKTAINLGGIKNIVGAFYQPKKVLIDPDVLQTLDSRQFSAGLAEAVKMALTSDAELFSLFESGSIEENLETIIIKSLQIKKAVVEQDEKENGLRKILNFGHTIGHGIESLEERHTANGDGLYHGECVALGMLPLCSDAVRARLLPVLKKLGLPTEYKGDLEAVFAAMAHDKKAKGDIVTAVLVEEAGSFELKAMTRSQLRDALHYFA
ncbi:MAG: 3-dehydroquinate synthase [Firmicutes bacterium]|nr:3-dehydroquinate synthase [Bacillota bacterium]